MKTRTTNYELVDDRFAVISNTTIHMLHKHDMDKFYMTDQEKIQSINAIHQYFMQYFDMFSKLRDFNHICHVDETLLVILKKMKILNEGIFLLSLKMSNKTRSFETVSKTFSNTCKKFRKKTFDYFNRKYICILFRTNTHIYREILSYIGV